MKKIKLFVFALCAMLVAVMGVSASNGSLPQEDPEGTITLNDDVTLSSTYTVDSSKTLTIDLNGHKITGPSNGYAISNEGDLTIKDSATNKGTILCNSNQETSCVRNAKNLVVDGANIESTYYVSLKNEPNGTMTVKNNSVIKSTIDNTIITGLTATIFNLGDLTIENSEVSSSGRSSTAILGLDYTGPGTGSGNSTTKIISSNVTATGIGSTAVSANNGGEIKIEDSNIDSIAADGNDSNITVEGTTINNGINGPVSSVDLIGENKSNSLNNVKYASDNSRFILT